jgi:hypothetical protein
MTITDYHRVPCPCVGARSDPSPGSGACSFRPLRNHARTRWNCRTPVVVAVVWTVQQSGQYEGVHNVHTLGFGSGRTSAGLARTGYVFGSSQCLQGLESGSSPTSGTCFPCSGACGPLSVHKLFTDGSPSWALFVLSAALVAKCLFPGARRFLASSLQNLDRTT